MTKIKIFGIGGSGLIGSRVVELLKDKYDIDTISQQTGVDITRIETLNNITNDSSHQCVILFAAKADVDGCEKDKPLGEQGDAYKINVLGVKNVIEACKKNNKKLIYISTDFVFDGENPSAGGYTEEDTPKPINWYGETKLKGEETVKNSGIPFLILRPAFPYRKEFAPKKDFVRAMLGRLQNNQPVVAITDHIMTPTFIDDIAFALDKLIETNASGIYHIVGSQSLTPYDAALLIAKKFDCNTSLISKTTRAEFSKERAPRPFNLSMNNDKIIKLGVTMRTFAEGLEVISKS